MQKMKTNDLPTVMEMETRPAPAITPQALAFHGGMCWIGSRDLRRVYAVDPQSWELREEVEAPGIPWAAVSVGDALWFTLGEGEEDDRYLRRFWPGRGFAAESERIACPDFTGSYLSWDGTHLHLSQWYKKRILKLDGSGAILREIDVGAEICGHTFVDGLIYVLRGTEADGENWRIARLDPREENPQVEDLARVPFACRSLAHDGERFWSNHRAAAETVSFSLPASRDGLSRFAP